MGEKDGSGLLLEMAQEFKLQGIREMLRKGMSHIKLI